MSREAARFGEVRSVLTRGSGERLFEAVCALWPVGDVPHDVIAYVQGVTRRWPSGVPCAVPGAWRDLIMRGEPCVGVSMCKTLRVEMHDVEGEWWKLWEGERVRHGLTGLELSTRSDVVPRKSLMPHASFWSSRLARGIHHLHLQGLMCDQAGMMALGLAPCMSRLRSLGFERCDMSLEAGRAFLRAAPSMRLDALMLRELVDDGVRRMGDELGVAWVESGLVAHVERLDLSGNALTGYAVGRLCASRTTARLTHLDLSDNTLARDLLGTLATNYWSSQLHELVYRAQDLEHDVLAALLRTPHFRRLHTLDLSHGTVGLNGVEALFGSTVMQRLRVLDLSHCGLGDLGAYALASAGPFSMLERLGLAGNGLSDEGIEVLCTGVLSPSLRELDVRENDFTSRGVQALELLSLGACEVTWVGNTAYRAQVERALAHYAMHIPRETSHQIEDLNEHLKWARLARPAHSQEGRAKGEARLVILPYGELPSADMAWMATWPELRYLTHLDMSGSMCGMDFIRDVLGSPHAQRIRVLDVRRSQVDSALVSWLETWPGRAALRELAISVHNLIECQRVLSARWPQELERLIVECDAEMRERVLEIWSEQGATHVELMCVEPPPVEPLYDTMTR